MKVVISYEGNLKVVAENETELYALKKWIEDSVDYSKTEDVITVLMGSLDITNSYIDPELPGEESLIDHVMEMKECHYQKKQ